MTQHYHLKQHVPQDANVNVFLVKYHALSFSTTITKNQIGSCSFNMDID